MAFKTKNGRTVYDKGGVEPDVTTPDVEASNVLVSLVLNNLIFDFANQYHADHSEIPPAAEFKVDDNLYNEFVNFLKNKDYQYKTETEYVLDDIKEAAEADHYWEKIESLCNAISEKIKQEKASDLQTYKKEIAEYLASEIAVRYYYQKGRICSQLSIDPDIATAKEILNDNARYRSILKMK